MGDGFYQDEYLVVEDRIIAKSARAERPRRKTIFATSH
jgi:hypothetical protein